MFKFLKEKLNNVVKKFSKEVEEEAEVVKTPVEEKKQEPKVVEKKEKAVEEKIQEDKKHEPKEEIQNKKETQKKHISDKPEKIPENKEKKLESKKEEKHDKKKLDYEELKEDIIINEPLKKIIEEQEEKKGFFSKLFHKKEEKEIKQEEKQEIKKEIKEEIIHEKKKESTPQTQKIKKDNKQEKIKEELPKEKEEIHKEEKKGFFGKVSDTFTKIQLSEQKFDELFWDIEITLLENNVAVEVIELIKQDLKEELTTGKISRKNVQEIIVDTLKESLDKVLSVEKIDLEKEIKKKKPYIIAVIGVNGSGKTTAIAKLTHLLQKKGHSVVIAAADTFRAAAIHQIEEHAEKLGTKLIKHDYNSDPAAVAFDAIKHAQSKGIDVVLIDTAGRMHSNDNLMQELKKLIRVNKPDMKLFVGESITGNDCVEQAKKYNEEIGIDAIILTKADVDEKGGAAISISHVTGKPILFMGTGQTYDDLEIFDKKKILANLGL